MERLKNTTINLRIVSVPVEIRTGYLPNIKLRSITVGANLLGNSVNRDYSRKMYFRS
jgi:hypothetical protein